MDLWAVVPVKERDRAKERLAPLLPPEMRQALALAMLDDVLAALAAASGLAGVIVVTVDREARRLALGYGARILEDGARDGHTGAVAAAARAARGRRACRDADPAGRHPARHRRRNRPSRRGASPGAVLYDRPVA